MTDLTNELRRLAQASSHPTTKGRWIRLFGERTVYDRMEDGCRGIPVVSTDKHPPSPSEAACLDFIAAANPATVIELLDRLEAAEKERDALRAKIDAMERQEPVAHVWRCDNGHIHGSCESELLMGQQLYALPGAQPQLNEIKIALQRALGLGQRETWTGARKHRSWEDQCEEQQCWDKVWNLLGAKGE